jgi:hypothetical protein
MADALRTTKRCEKCGLRMPAGSLAYEVRIEVCADFDGVLSEAETHQDARAQMQALVTEMTARDPDELMREVYHRERHLLCPGCRDRFLANPLNLPLREELP